MTLEKDEVLLCLVQNFFLKAKGPEDIPEPVVIRQNNDFNIFPLIQESLREEYKVSGDKFWGLVKKVHGSDDASKEIWRPRFQGYQLKCLGSVRYPQTVSEWHNFEAAMAQIGSALKPEASPPDFVRQIQAFVEDFGEIWRSERRHKYKRNRETEGDLATVGRVVEERPLEGEFQSHHRPTYFQARGNAANNNDAEILLDQIDPIHSRSGEQTSQNEGQTLDKDKVIAELTVGGKVFTTTMATLHSVPGSFFSKLIKFSDGASEFFVDRSPLMFDFILDYLRATRYNEPLENFPLPDGIHELKLLRRESVFYRLPVLAFLVEERIERKKFPKIDIVVLETPEVPSEQDLHNELQALSKKANSLMEAKLSSPSVSFEKIEIVSHDVRVLQQGSNLRARVALTLRNS